MYCIQEIPKNLTNKIHAAISKKIFRIPTDYMKNYSLSEDFMEKNIQVLLGVGSSLGMKVYKSEDLGLQYNYFFVIYYLSNLHVLTPWP